MRGARSRLARQPAPLIADDNGQSRRSAAIAKSRSRGVSPPHRDVVVSEERVELRPGCVQRVMAEERSHRATDDFGVPEVNRPRRGDGQRDVERRGGAQDGSDVPRILNGVEHEHASALGP